MGVLHNKKIKMKNIESVVIGVIQKDTHVFIAKRRPNVFLGGLWEFPGGKVEAGETLFQALARELKEEVGIDVQDAQLWYQDQIEYPDREVHLSFWMVDEFLGEPVSNESQEVRWVPVSSLENFEFPPGSHAVISRLIQSV